jgi:hypothetical protein
MGKNSGNGNGVCRYVRAMTVLITDKGIIGFAKWVDIIVIRINISLVVEFQRWWLRKCKMFGQESSYLKENNLKITKSQKSVDECQFANNWARF